MHTYHENNPSTPERLHGLDALRMALLLGESSTYPCPTHRARNLFWIVSDTERSSLLAGMFYVIHLFRMPLFFLLAGYFGRLALQRLGTVAFARDRFRRVVLPLIGTLCQWCSAALSSPSSGLWTSRAAVHLR